MRFGVNALIWTPDVNSFDAAVLCAIRDAGFSAFEVPMFDPHKIDVSRIRTLLEQNDLECTVCCILPRGLSPISADEATRRNTLTHLRECVSVAGELGARIMGGPVYAPIGFLPGRRRTSDEWKWAVDAFQSLTERLISCGVTLVLEPLNRFETFFLNTVDDTIALCHDVGSPNVGALLDTFHLNIEEKSFGDAIRRAAPYLRHIHAGENDRGIPGSGHVDFPGIAKALAEIGYDGLVVIESFGFWESELAAAAAIWRDLAPSPEAIAFQGIRNLREIFEGRAAGAR